MTDTSRVNLPAQPGPRDAPPAAPTTATPGTTAPAKLVHGVTVEHRGNFAHAACSGCGWRGPGRRAMSSARDDAEAHTLLG